MRVIVTYKKEYGTFEDFKDITKAGPQAEFYSMEQSLGDNTVDIIIPFNVIKKISILYDD